MQGAFTPSRVGSLPPSGTPCSHSWLIILFTSFSSVCHPLPLALALPAAAPGPCPGPWHQVDRAITACAELHDLKEAVLKHQRKLDRVRPESPAQVRRGEGRAAAFREPAASLVRPVGRLRSHGRTCPGCCFSQEKSGLQRKGLGAGVQAGRKEEGSLLSLTRSPRCRINRMEEGAAGGVLGPLDPDTSQNARGSPPNKTWAFLQDGRAGSSLPPLGG